MRRFRVLTCLIKVLMFVAAFMVVISLIGVDFPVYGQETADRRTIEGARTRFAEQCRRLEDKRDADIVALNARYGQSLSRSAEQAQKDGELETLLTLQSEIDRFNTKHMVPHSSSDAFLAKWYAAYHEQYDALVKQFEQSMKELTSRYLGHLELMKQELTKAGNVKEALAFMKEAELVKKGQQMPPEPIREDTESLMRDHVSNGVQAEVVKDREPVGLERPIVSFGAERRTGIVGSNLNDLQVRHHGDNRIMRNGIHLVGGRTTIEGADAALLAACKDSQALTITAALSTRRPQQTGPARIVSFSLDAHRRNVSLCQEGSRLVLRLRTTDTGLNGTDPQVTLCSLDRREVHRIAVTYRPGDLRFFLNGERIAVAEITGSFDNWEPCHLVLGNEWEGDRPWVGLLEQFAIYARFMEDDEALFKTKP